MDNSITLRLLAIKMDNEALGLMSHTPAWELIKPLLTDQSFWFERTQTLVNFELAWEPSTNWHQVYNILLETEHGNPFLDTVLLEKNDYNATAIKLLLRLKYDSSVLSNNLFVQMCRRGSDDIVNLLLADLASSRDPDQLAWDIERALEQAIKYDRISTPQGGCPTGWGTVKLLLENEIVLGVLKSHIRIMKNILSTCILHDRLAIFKLLIQLEFIFDYKSISLRLAAQNGAINILNYLLEEDSSQVESNIVGTLLEDAISYQRTEAVRLLLSRAQEINRTEELLNLAISRDDAQTVRLLLSDSRFNYTRETVLEVACLSSKIEVARSMLEDRADLEPSLLEDAFWKVRTDVVKLLVSSPQSTSTIESILESLEDLLSARARSTLLGLVTINALLSSSPLDLKKLSPRTIEFILLHAGGEIAHCLSQAINLSGESEKKIVQRISRGETDFNLLLREIILKRLDLKYYLVWLVRAPFSIETKQLLLDAARSLHSTEPVVHTSPLFTAYSGFFLLVNSNDKRAIMNTLRLELEADPSQTLSTRADSLRLAGLLVGGFKVD